MLICRHGVDPNTCVPARSGERRRHAWRDHTMRIHDVTIIRERLAVARQLVPAPSKRGYLYHSHPQSQRIESHSRAFLNSLLQTAHDLIHIACSLTLLFQRRREHSTTTWVTLTLLSDDRDHASKPHLEAYIAFDSFVAVLEAAEMLFDCQRIVCKVANGRFCARRELWPRNPPSRPVPSESGISGPDCVGGGMPIATTDLCSSAKRRGCEPTPALGRVWV